MGVTTLGVALTLTLASGRRRTAPSSYGIRPALVSRYGRQRKNRHPKEKGSGSRGGKLGRSTVSHRNEAGGAQIQSTQDGCGQPYPASRDMTTPFSLWIPSLQAMGYKAKGKWEALGDGACRRRYGQPERERSYKTSLFLLWLLLHPIPLPGYRLPV